MNDLFNVSPPPVAVNNDIVEVRFRVLGGPEQVAIGRVAQCLAALASRGQRGVTSAEFAAGHAYSAFLRAFVEPAAGGRA